MLTINNLSYRKEEKIIFRSISFSMGIGSALIVTGKNGSGKTSFLRVLSGLYKPFLGNILWCGENIEKIYDYYYSSIQYISDKSFLKENLTVRDNLYLYNCLYRTKLLFAPALKYFELEEIADLKINYLSKGWKKKVLLAKLLCSSANIWFLDEPTVNLDQRNKELLFNLISLRVRDGGLVIIATHDRFLFPLGDIINMEDY